MKVQLYGKTYEVNPTLANSSRNLVQQILDNIKVQAETNNVQSFYTSVVMMMYTVSSIALKEMSMKDINAIMKKDDGKGENK